MLLGDVYSELYDLFAYNPTTLRPSEFEKPSISYPSLTYDKHLDPRLILRNVEMLPTFLIDAAQVAAKKVEALKEGGHHIPHVDSNGGRTGGFRTKKYRDAYLHDATANTAHDVARFYEDTSFDICASVASTLSLHTDAETWLSIMEFRQGKSMRLNDYFCAVTDIYQLNFGRKGKGELNVPDAIWSRLDEVTQARIRQAEVLFQDLGNVANSMVHELPMQCPDITGSLVVEHPHLVSADANITLRALSVASLATATSGGKVEVRKSVRLTSRKPLKVDGKKTNGSISEEKESPTEKWRTITIKPKMRGGGASSFIHRAWVRSVQDDTSFIVFNCGKYERLGFRHRSSQTLYLSDLIDVMHGSEPAYGAIHIGLYMMVLQDVLDRVEQIEALTETKTAKRKRNDSSEKGNAKRRRTRATAPKAAKGRQLKEAKSRTVAAEVRGRNLMLLRLQYGSYNSPAPTSCYRLGRPIGSGSTSASVTSKPKHKYRPDEYFYVTLTSELLEGATGRLHLAQMKVQTAAKLVHECEVVVKVALEPEQQKRVRHEYNVYRHLATQGVKQIPQIYGLFEEASEEAVILVMNNVGKSLDENDYWRHGSLRDEEKEAFKCAMTDIHQAGVRHYDIRPENLVMDDAGNATLIDFDQAKIGAGSHSRQREYKHLCRLLEGDDNYDLPNQFPSPRTTQGSASDHEDSN
ncbi:hypothetical protein APHAL10511_006851 [Amanita phalloides]|nr:hypothetical protein APHAL10511_006851 [Amanita phalloides]